MSKRKSIFAIALFVIVGLFIYSFASPNRERKQKEDDGPKMEEKGKTDNSKNHEETTEGELEAENTPSSERGTITHVTGDGSRREEIVVVRVNYELLKEAVLEAKEIINNDIVKNYIYVDNLVSELNNEVADGIQILNNRISTQEEVNNKITSINDLINRINKTVNEDLNEVITEGKVVFEEGNAFVLMFQSEDDNNDEQQNFSRTLLGLSGEIEGGSNGFNTTSERINYIGKLKDRIANLRKLFLELYKINNANVTLKPGTEEWTKEDVELVFEGIDPELSELVSESKVFKIININREVITAINNNFYAKENGEYFGIVKFKNGAWKTTEKLEITNIDKEAPIVEILSPETELLTKETKLNLEVKATDNKQLDKVGVIVLNNEGLVEEFTKYANLNEQELTFTEHLDNLETGYYEIKVVAYDKAGNKSIEKTLKFEVDSTPAQIEITNVAELNPDSFWVSASDCDSGLRRIDYSLWTDNNKRQLGVWGEHISGEIFKKELTGYKKDGVFTSLDSLSSGEYTIRATVSDNARNVTNATSINFIVDKTKPVLELISPEGEIIIQGPDLSLAFKATDETQLGGKLVIDLFKEGTTEVYKSFSTPSNGQKFTYTHLLENLEEGNYYFEANVRDMAGNVSNTINKNIKRTFKESDVVSLITLAEASEITTYNGYITELMLKDGFTIGQASDVRIKLYSYNGELKAINKLKNGTHKRLELKNEKLLTSPFGPFGNLSKDEYWETTWYGQRDKDIVKAVVEVIINGVKYTDELELSTPLNDVPENY